jgi:hypothetical protein
MNALMMAAVSIYETSVIFYQITRLEIPDYKNYRLNILSDVLEELTAVIIRVLLEAVTS